MLFLSITHLLELDTPARIREGLRGNSNNPSAAKITQACAGGGAGKKKTQQGNQQGHRVTLGLNNSLRRTLWGCRKEGTGLPKKRKKVGVWVWTWGGSWTVEPSA